MYFLMGYWKCMSIWLFFLVDGGSGPPDSPKKPVSRSSGSLHSAAISSKQTPLEKAPDMPKAATAVASTGHCSVRDAKMSFFEKRQVQQVTCRFEWIFLGEEVFAFWSLSLFRCSFNVFLWRLLYFSIFQFPTFVWGGAWNWWTERTTPKIMSGLALCSIHPFKQEKRHLRRLQSRLPSRRRSSWPLTLRMADGGFPSDTIPWKTAGFLDAAF